MPTIKFMPSQKIVEVPKGTSLFEAGKQAGVSVSTPCGCKGICGKCLVKIVSGQVEFENEGLLSQKLLSQGYVPVCKAVVADSSLEVLILSDLSGEKGKFDDSSDDLLLVSSELLPENKDFDFICKSVNLEISAPSYGDGLSDYDRLVSSLQKNLNITNPEIPLDLLQKLPNILRESEKNNTKSNITAVYYNKSAKIVLADIVSESNGEDLNRFGIAVDIGTTTVAIQLVNLENGSIIYSKTAYNEQIKCGLDVISRINYARKPEHLAELKDKITSTINALIIESAKKQDIDPLKIFNIAISANTTMVHLLLGIVPEYIRLDPYTPAVYSVELYTAGSIGLSICPNAPVYIAPSVGSYVGADITAGALCTSLACEDEDICLFIDIGTNGEILLGNNEFLLGCACSAGPAFEGGGITHGMRASNGAIERVEIDESKNIKCFTIGNSAPVGICGSGIISLIAALFRYNIIDAAGKFTNTDSDNYVSTNNSHSSKNPALILTKRGNNSNDISEDITLSESDIDNFLRAKAAIFSAISLMLNNIGLEFADLSRVYVSGGFGRYLNLDDAKTIGLIPPLDHDKFTFLGNSSLMGSYMTVLSQKHRDKITQLAQRITYLDLSTEPKYMDEYMAALFIPHTNSSLFM